MYMYMYTYLDFILPCYFHELMPELRYVLRNFWSLRMEKGREREREAEREREREREGKNEIEGKLVYSVAN